MAAGLGFKDFTTGEVLTAADVDGYLMQGIWVFASAAARSSAVTSPQEGNYSFLKDTNSTEYYDGSAWVAAGGGGGKVLQVIYAMYDTETTIATSTFTDTGLTATITPSSATSKVYIFANTGVYSSKNTTNSGGIATKLFRGATEVFVNDNIYSQAQFISAPSGSGYAVSGYIPLQYLDSPATTSATTYKIQGSAGGSGVFQRLAMKSNIILMEIGA